ncbi:carbon-nitrogen hydrolase family protein [Mycobacterium sp. 050134]|uniref:carbon-nitrogen hydrolase family protein n=1 Tax=Mycobacterium sp. 050134 TaxID=3096111 RepID=UPI002ED942EB
MRVAAYQAPHLPFGSMDAVGLINDQLERCEREAVELLCCPDAVIGGLAYEPAGQSPDDVALSLGEFRGLVRPLMASSVASVIGFTERATDGRLFNSAAFLADGDLHAVYRKVYPGYCTAICAGTELPVATFNDTTFGLMICNDIWYVEPARILASKGAALILIPTNSGHIRSEEVLTRLRRRGKNLPVARAVDNTVTIVVADIVGEQDGRQALGSSCIIDPDGEVLAAATDGEDDLIFADLQPHSRPYDPRGWDGHLNPNVSREYTSLLTPTTD